MLIGRWHKSILILSCLLTLLPTATFALNNIESCTSHLKAAEVVIKKLEDRLPEVPSEADTYFSEQYRKKGMPLFTRLKNHPHYYLWLLQHDVIEALNELKNTISTASDTDAKNAIGFAGGLAVLLSNLRNSWTEYAVHADDQSITNQIKEMTSDDMLTATITFNFYLTCLVDDIE